MDVNVRSERAEDAEDIMEVVEAAFADMPYANGREQYIACALRDAGELALSLVAEHDDDIVGHVAVSRVSISDGSVDWYGLGPLAVSPCFQGRGIGAALVREALEQLRQAGARGCVLLGDPDYYGRFGFRRADTLTLPGAPAEYFQVLILGEPEASGDVSYHPAYFE